MKPTTKEIKINFIGFWSNFDKNDNFFSNILKKRYQVVISDSPDFVIVDPLCKPFEYMKYDCVRILYSGEPLHPDFNVFDYAIGFDQITFGDRYLKFPCFLLNKEKSLSCNALSRAEASSIISEKEYFCNFIYSHESPNGERKRILDVLEMLLLVIQYQSILVTQLLDKFLTRKPLLTVMIILHLKKFWKRLLK